MESLTDKYDSFDRVEHLVVVLRGIAPYRVEFFNQLYERYCHRLTIVGAASQLPEGVNKGIGLVSVAFKERRGFRLIRNLHSVVESLKPSIVVVEFNPKVITHWLLVPWCRIKLHVPVIFWGIGAREGGAKAFALAGYAHLANGLALYEDKARQKIGKWLGKGYPVAVLHNTVHSEKPIIEEIRRNSVLYVGALTKRKRLDELFRAAALLRKQKVPIELLIVGDGAERVSLENLAEDIGIAKNVKFFGEIRDKNELREIYSQALMACCPGQAGLFVLQAFANGVPFVTKVNAVTGGEIENIVDGQNGVLYQGGVDQLVEVLRLAYARPGLMEKYGKNAYEFYWAHRQVIHMVDRFVELCKRVSAT